MTRATTAALFGALALAGSAQAASPSVQAFETLCVANPGDDAAIMRAADAAGWMPVPDLLLKAFAVGAGFAAGDFRMRTDREAMYFLIVGEIPPDKDDPDITMKACAVAAMPSDAAVLETEVADWVGLPPNDDLTDKKMAGYAYVEDGGRKAANLGDDMVEAKALMRKGTLRMVMVSRAPPRKSAEDLAMIILMVPRL